MATIELREIILADNADTLSAFPNWYIADYRNELHQLAEESSATECLAILAVIQQAKPLSLDEEPVSHNPTAHLSIAELDNAVAELSDEELDEALDGGDDYSSNPFLELELQEAYIQHPQLAF